MKVSLSPKRHEGADALTRNLFKFMLVGTMAIFIVWRTDQRVVVVDGLKKGNSDSIAVDNSFNSETTSVRSHGLMGGDTSRGDVVRGIDKGSPLAIPQGQAESLPSIRVEKEEVSRDIHGTKYGGDGDKKHLGGFTLYDGQGVSPTTWKYMIQHFGIKSLMDIGCGKGVSTLWFHLHGVEVLCLEGSHDGVSHTLLPDPATQVVEHDFSRGPYWPGKTYDAIWCVEFLEHVGRNFQYNYIQAFRKAALIFASHSQWGGWHHVEVHDDDWWREKFESFGFKYSDRLTKMIRGVASGERNTAKANNDLGPNDEPYNAQHVWLNMQVFVNPMVASLPEHAHLFAEPGCYKDRSKEGIVNRKCGEGKGSAAESTLPPNFYPLELSPEQDEAWLKIMKDHIKQNS